MKYKQIKICIISPAGFSLLVEGTDIPTAGGAEAQLTTLGLALSARGHIVDFIVDDFGQRKQENVGKITLHRVPLRYMGGSNWYVLPDWLNFIKALLKIDAEIHLIKVPKNLLFPLSLYCRLCGKKAIFVGQRDVDAMGGFDGVSDSRFAHLCYQMGMKMCHAVVAQTQTQKEGFFKVYHKPARVIKNVVTLPQLSVDDKEDYVLWVGNGSTRKQPDLFVRLASELKDVRFKMIMAPGIGQSDDATIRDLSLDMPNFEYVGFVPFDKIASYYQKARVFVSTSTSEGFPNTFLQSWQYSTPTVSLNVDPDGVIRDFDLGRVSGNFAQLVKDVKEFVNDDELISRIGANAARYVEENHSLNSAVDSYLQLFNCNSL